MADAVDGYDVETLSPHRVESRRQYERLNAALDLTNATLDLAYGDHPRQRLDIFPAESAGAPVMLFFHGGYWKGGSKESRRFPARTFNDAGATWVSVEYPLCPEVGIEAIVASARFATAWLLHNIARFGGDPARIFVCGNSAGGHLVAMLAATGWARDYGLAANPVRGVTAISPLADLRALVGHPFNATFGLTTESAAELSPVLLEFEAAIPLIVAVGGLETPEFQWHSRILAESRKARGDNVVSLVIPERDHVSIVGDLDDRGSPLAHAILTQMRIA